LNAPLSPPATRSRIACRRWLAFLPVADRPRIIRVQLVTSEAHRGLVDAIAATLPGASWQRSSVNIIVGGMVPLVHLRRRERTLAA
jgi:transposase-like protein